MSRTPNHREGAAAPPAVQSGAGQIAAGRTLPPPLFLSVGESTALRTVAAPEPVALPKPRRRVRWWIRIPLGLLALLLVLLIATQIVLWSSLPRSLVLGQLESQLGLRTQVSRVSAGWTGATLRGVKLSLPLASQSFIELTEMRVRYNWLPLMLLAGPRLTSVELNAPVLDVSQTADGTWNLAQLKELFTKRDTPTGASSTRAQAMGAKALPVLSIVNATVNVHALDGRKLIVAPANIQGEPDGNLVWRYKASIADVISVEGRAAPSDAWSTELTFSVKPGVSDLIRPWFSSLPGVAVQDGKWIGHSTSTGFAGRLEFAKLTVDQMNASGAMAVSIDNSGISLRPDQFQIETGQKFAPALVATGGVIGSDGKKIQITALQWRVSGGQMRVDGTFDTASNGGELSVIWDGISLPAGQLNQTSQGGSLRATVATRLAGRPEFRGTLTTRGIQGATRLWDGQIAINGDGRSWSDMDWTATATKLIAHIKTDVPLNGLAMSLREQGPQLTLVSVTLPNSKSAAGDSPVAPPLIQASGAYNFSTQNWAFKANGQGWEVQQIEDDTLGFAFDADGDKAECRLHDLSLTASGAMVQVTGAYVYRKPKPLDVVVVLKHPWAPAVTANPQGGKQPSQQMAIAAPPPLADDSLISGELAGSVHVTGTLAPRELSISGDLTGKNVTFRGKAIGDFDGAVHGFANESVTDVQADQLSLLDATWSASAQYAFDPGTTMVHLTMRGFDLHDRQVQAFAGRDDLQGEFQGVVSVAIPGITARRQHIHASGSLEGRNLVAPGFAADTLHADLHFDGSTILVDPVELRRAGTSLSATRPSASTAAVGELAGNSQPGTIRFSVATSLADFHHLALSGITAQHWPYPIPAAQTELAFSAQSERIDLDLPNTASTEPDSRALRITGLPLSVAATVDARLVGGRQLHAGDIGFEIQPRGRQIQLQQAHFGLLGGIVNADALVDLDHPMLSEAAVRGSNIDFNRISQVYPAADRVQGHYDFAVEIQPSVSQVALEPLRIEGRLTSAGASVGAMQLGNIRFRAYANINPDWHLVRLVSSNQPQDVPTLASVVQRPGDRPSERGDPEDNTLQIAGGKLRFWTRLSVNENEAGIEGATSLSTYCWLGLENLDLNQLVHAGGVSPKKIPGRVSGLIDLYGTTAIKLPKNRVPSDTPGIATTASSTPAIRYDVPFLIRLERSLYGDGTVKLTDCDLGDFAPIAIIYNLMHIGGDAHGPSGTGNATFRVEASTLNLTTARYFNRGVEVRAQATVRNFPELPESQIQGTAVGSARPLKDIKLPILSGVLPDLDAILSALQSTTASIQIGGTLKALKVLPIPFADIGQSMRAFLIGDIQGQIQPETAR